MHDHVIVLAITAAALLLLKLQKRFRHEHYFYYGLLLDGLDSDFSWFGMIYRTSIPVVGGFAAAVFAAILGGTQSPGFYGVATGFLTAFLVVWPSIFCPEIANPPIYFHRLKLLYLMRLMFVALYSSLGYLGGQLSALVFQLAVKFGHIQAPNWMDGKGIVTNLIAALLWTLIATLCGFAYRWIQRRLK